MDHLWLKALHAAAVLAFVRGLLAQSVALAAARAGKAEGGAVLLAGLRRRDRLVTVPALLLVWVLGAAAASWSGCFGAGWLSAMLVLVATLSGLHGVQSGQLRRMAAGVEPPGWVRWSPAAVVAAATAIAPRAVAKPF